MFTAPILAFILFILLPSMFEMKKPRDAGPKEIKHVKIEVVPRLIAGMEHIIDLEGGFSVPFMEIEKDLLSSELGRLYDLEKVFVPTPT